MIERERERGRREEGRKREKEGEQRKGGKEIVASKQRGQ